ncbi:MAG: EamA family transporter RarD [Actinomycetaceae bacterium]|nr:EamA family transporter RarD [Actinomycetaceae bacterium]
MATVGEQQSAKGYFLAVTTYLLWGLFPLYFSLLAGVGALEIIVHRAFWGLLTCLVWLTLTLSLPSLRAVWRDRRSRNWLFLAGYLIALNWTTYVYAVTTGRTVDAALGYFVNPIVTAALGIFVLREQVNRFQMTAIALGVVAVVVVIVGTRTLPWVSMVLAISFGVYSLAKKKVSAGVPAVTGMFYETVAIIPPLGVYQIFLVYQGEDAFHSAAITGSSPGVILALLAGAGVITVFPLVMFAAAAKELPLGIIGLLQYISPVMQLVIGVVVFHEYMPTARWVGTAIVWVALMFLAADSVRATRRRRQLARG